MRLGSSFFQEVALVEFIRYIICLVFTRMPGGVTVGDLGLSCCVPCLLSAVHSPCSLIIRWRSTLHSVSGQSNAEDSHYDHVRFKYFVICRSSGLRIKRSA